MRKLILILFLILPVLCLGQQTTTITGTVKYPGGPVINGTICVLGTDTKDVPENYKAGGGWAVSTDPGCTGASVPVSNGVIQPGLIIPDVRFTTPANMCMRIQVFDTSGQQILRFKCAQPFGPVWDISQYNPNFNTPALPSNGAAANLSVTGDATIGGTLTAGTVKTANLYLLNSTAGCLQESASGQISSTGVVCNLVSSVAGRAGNVTLTAGDVSGLAAVATSGSYSDLSNRPSIPAAQVNADWNATSGIAQILNKPSIPGPQVNSDWNATSGVTQILNKPVLAAVATSGSYNDLSNKPSIPAAQVNADWNATSGIAHILNQPTFAAVAISGSYNDLTNKPTLSGMAWPPASGIPHYSGSNSWDAVYGTSGGGSTLVLQNQPTINGLFISGYALPSQFITATNSTLGIGAYNCYVVGHDAASLNAGSICYTYSGNSSSASFLGLGLYNDDRLLNVFGTGDVSIGSTSDISRLSISGTTPSVGAPVMIYNTGTSGALRGMGLLAPNAPVGATQEAGTLFAGIDVATANDCAFFTFANAGGSGSTNNHGSAGMCGQNAVNASLTWSGTGVKINGDLTSTGSVGGNSVVGNTGTFINLVIGGLSYQSPVVTGNRTNLVGYIPVTYQGSTIYVPAYQ
jgi:hypothetical protein